jgi:protein-disulfide isomerase
MDRSEVQLLADPVTLEDHAKGRLDAEIELVQYGDYECPFTRLSRLSVHALQRELKDRLLFVFRHFPLEEIHPHARLAAAAAEAAAAQGEFWTMHEHLFEHQNALGARDLHRYAAELGLDAGRFERDRSSETVAERIDRDLVSGERSGVGGTPTFYINRVRHDGSYDVQSLRAAITLAPRRR